MKKILTLLLIFIVIIILISLSVSYFLIPREKKIRFAECVVMQNSKTNEIDCFGCINNLCKDAPIDWQVYAMPPAGVPYKCLETDQGCQLAP